MHIICEGCLQMLLLVVYATKNTGNATTLYINSSMPISSKLVSTKLSCLILHNYKESHWYSFKSSQTTAVFSRKNNELLREFLFSSSCPELYYEKGFLKIFAKFGKHLCWKLPTLLKVNTGTGVVLHILQNFLRMPILSKTYKPLLLYIARLIILACRSLFVLNLLLIHLV